MELNQTKKIKIPMLAGIIIILIFLGIYYAQTLKIRQGQEAAITSSLEPSIILPLFEEEKETAIQHSYPSLTQTEEDTTIPEGLFE